jgi:hypothetical protein
MRCFFLRHSERSAEGASSRNARKPRRFACEREGASSGYFFFFYSTARAFALALGSDDRGASLDDAPYGAARDDMW